MPISISANVLALRHSWGRYGSRTTPACLHDSTANAGPTRRRSSILLSCACAPGPPEARIRARPSRRVRLAGAPPGSLWGKLGPWPIVMSMPPPPPPPQPCPAACGPSWPGGTTALADGAAPVGWKIGFNTPAIQEHFGLTEAVVGYLVDTGVSPDGRPSRWPAGARRPSRSRWRSGSGADGEVAGLAPALELVDLGISFDDIEPVLAANICHRGVIFGDEVPGVDPWAMVAHGDEDGSVVAEGRLVEDPAHDGCLRAVLPRCPRRRAAAGRPHHRRVRGGTGRRGAGRRARAWLSGRSGQLSVRFGTDGRRGVGHQSVRRSDARSHPSRRWRAARRACGRWRPRSSRRRPRRTARGTSCRRCPG